MPCNSLCTLCCNQVCALCCCLPPRELYERFFDAFESMGEPNVPVDRTFICSEEYMQLLERLRGYAAQHHRDHWCGGVWGVGRGEG